MDGLGYDPFKGIDGTAAAPAFTFKDEPDTGIYRKTTDTIGFAAGGAEIGSLASKALSFGSNAKIYCGGGTVEDDGSITLPAHTVFMFGWVVAKVAASFALFNVSANGTVDLLTDVSGDIVANANTDNKLCIGSAETQNPLQIKNRLGDAYDVNYFIVYY